MADTASKPSKEQLEFVKEMGREAVINAGKVFSGKPDNTEILNQVGKEYSNGPLNNESDRGTVLSKIHFECVKEERGTANLDAYVQGIKDKARELGIAHDKEDTHGHAITRPNICHAVNVHQVKSSIR